MTFDRHYSADWAQVQEEKARAAELTAAAEIARGKLLAGDGDIDAVARLEGVAARAVRALNLPSPAERDHTPLRDRWYGEEEDDEIVDQQAERCVDTANGPQQPTGESNASPTAPIPPAHIDEPCTFCSAANGIAEGDG